MRHFDDDGGQRWTVSEIPDRGTSDRPPRPDVVTLHFESEHTTLEVEAPHGLLDQLSDQALGDSLAWARARQEVERSGRPMRMITDGAGITWLVTEEGLPGPHRGAPGGLALRFIAPQGRHYLTPLPSFWRHEADESLGAYLALAKELSA